MVDPEMNEILAAIDRRIRALEEGLKETQAEVAKAPSPTKLTAKKGKKEE